MKKITITLLSTLALAGAAVVAPSVGFTGQTVYANTQQTYINNSTETIGVIVYYVGKDANGQTKLLVDPAPLIEVGPGEEVAAPRSFDGYTLVEKEYLPPAFSEGMLTYFYESTSTTTPTQQPIEILVTHLVPPGSRGSDALILEQTTVSLNPGGQLFLEPKQFAGYTATTTDPVTLNYDEAATGKTSVTFSYRAVDNGGGNSGGTQTPPSTDPGAGDSSQTPPAGTPSDSGTAASSSATTSSSSAPAAAPQKVLPQTGENGASIFAALGVLLLTMTSFVAFKPRKN